MKNIAILISKLSGGGAERVASNLSLSLSKNYNVTLIVFDGKSITYPYSGEMVDLELPPSKNKLGKIVNIFKRVKRVRKIKKEKNISCTISLMDGPNLINVLSKQGDLIVTSVRIYLSHSENTNMFRKFLVKITSKLSDSVIALSKSVEMDLIDNFNICADKINVIYNSVDGEYLKSLPTKGSAVNSPKRRYITSMGRLTDQKGQWNLIKSFKEVAESIDDIDLYIIGEGKLYNQLSDLIIELKLENRVYLTGFIKNPHQLVSDSEFFVFSSLYEGLGNVILEALSCGKTVISTDCYAGPREILSLDMFNLPKEGMTDYEIVDFGILVPNFPNDRFNSDLIITEDHRVFSEAMKLLLNDRNLLSHLSQRSSDRASCYSPEIIENEWSKLIGKLLLTSNQS